MNVQAENYGSFSQKLILIGGDKKLKLCLTNIRPNVVRTLVAKLEFLIFDI